jgi:hypothetical protein
MFSLCSHAEMAETKGSILCFSIAFALSSVRLNRFRLGLSEEQRYEVAERTILELRKHGGWKDLDETVEPAAPAQATWKPPG